MARGFSYAPGASAEVEAAAAPGLSKERLNELGASRNALVREAIAGRADCPFGLMVTLAHDHVAAVRTAVAGNPRALRSILEYLARDRHPGVAGAVVANPSVPREVLEYLAVHRRPDVRRAAGAALDSWGPTDRQDVSALPELRDRVFDDTRVIRDARAALASSAASALADAASTDVPGPASPGRSFRPAPQA